MFFLLTKRQRFTDTNTQIKFNYIYTLALLYSEIPMLAAEKKLLLKAELIIASNKFIRIVKIPR
jgi:hypothetical protein